MERVSEGPDTFFRLSPVANGKPFWFAIRRGEITSRFDAKYFAFHEQIASARYPLVALGTLVKVEPDYGSGARAISRSGVDQPRYIRITDFGEDGIEPYHAYVTADYVEMECKLGENDLLFARSGATVGKTYIHEDTTEPSIFAGYCIRFRIRESSALPKFVYWYTKTAAYARWVATIQRPAGQPNINKEEFKTVALPLPDTTEQSKLVATMDAARAERRAKQAQADALLVGLDEYLLATLGLTPAPNHEQKFFAVTRSTVPARFDPHFHHPDFAQNERMLAANGGVPLGSIAMFSKEVWKPDNHDAQSFRYIEISSVDRATGEAQAVETLVAEAPSRARMAVHTGDIIVSLTRPHHGSIAQITPALDGCVASTGFAVIRNVDQSRVLNDYLWCVLRRKLCLTQMLQRASGGNYPAITEAELAKVLVPIPTLDIQNTIAVEARRRRDESRRLRADADSEWQTAKRWFEEQLLGPVHK
jgi:type I restriction enzyme S subunit